MRIFTVNDLKMHLISFTYQIPLVHCLCEYLQHESDVEKRNCFCALPSLLMCTNGMEMDGVAGSSVDEAKLRHKPVIHPPTDGPLCEKCRNLDKYFFDVECDGCLSLLYDEGTTVSQLFAIVRQWIPQTQQNILTIIEQVKMITLSPQPTAYNVVAMLLLII